MIQLPIAIIAIPLFQVSADLPENGLLERIKAERAAHGKGKAERGRGETDHQRVAEEVGDLNITFPPLPTI